MNRTQEYTIKSALALRTGSPENLEQIQLKLLKEHLHHARSIPFYNNRLQEKTIDAMQSIDDLRQLPYTSRADLEDFAPLFGIRSRCHIRDIALTSGTTGSPVVVSYTQNDLDRLAFNEAIAYYSAGVTPEDTVLLTATLDRCFIAGLAYYQGASRLGASVIRSGPGQPARQWQLIDQLKPSVVVGVPGFLKDLGLWGIEHGYNPALSSVDTLITIGDSIRKADLSLTAQGQDLKKIWQARIFSSYGATELETAFGECPAATGGHIHPELIIVEIRGDNGKLQPDGLPGEVVVTPLGVEGFPLVRFRTGDVARIHPGKCSCGWQTKRLGPVEGRLAQRLKYKGTTLYPEMIFHTLQDFCGINNAYVEVSTSSNGTDTLLVTAGYTSKPDQKAIEKMLQAHLRVRIPLAFAPEEQVLETITVPGQRKLKKFFDHRIVADDQGEHTP